MALNPTPFISPAQAFASPALPVALPPGSATTHQTPLPTDLATDVPAPLHPSLRIRALGETPLGRAVLEGFKDGGLAGLVMALPFGWYAKFEHAQTFLGVLLGLPILGACIGMAYRAYQSFKTQVAPNLKLK